MVIGCAGSGKTTFAKQLSKNLDIPLVHLDFYFHQEAPKYYDNEEEWKEKVLELASSKRWIIDGNYTSTITLRAKHADTIIFLDYPRKVYLFRVLKRQLLHKKRDDMPEDWKESISFIFLKRVWRYKKDERPIIMREINKHGDKHIVVLKNQNETDQFLADL